MPPNVSIAIPAKNEADSIGACLDSLTAQVTPGDEIIVLDNGSDDQTATISSEYDAVRVLDAPDSRFSGGNHVRGISHLRQLGANEAHNEIVATTDADTVPPDDWLDRIKAHFDADPDLTVLWGVVTDTNGVPVRDLTGKYLTFLGGVSGSNTAFRKRAFEALENGYMGWPMFEDVALITRLARTGKAVHDRGLQMHSDLDRRRYQTIPMVAAGAAGVGAGALLGGPVGGVVAGTGVGLAGTELVYEQVARARRGVRQTLDAAVQDTPLHHDQVGLALILGGVVAGGTPGIAAAGVGSGILSHHLLTEGASAIPTDLMQNTDELCRLDTDGDVPRIECETADATSAKVTRVLAGVTAGAVAGKGIALLKQA